MVLTKNPPPLPPVDFQQYAEEFENLLHQECDRVAIENESEDGSCYEWVYAFRGGACGCVSCSLNKDSINPPTVSVMVCLRDVSDLSEHTQLKLLQFSALLLDASLIILGIDEGEPILGIHSMFKIEDFPPQRFKSQIDRMLSQYSEVMSGGDFTLCAQ